MNAQMVAWLAQAPLPFSCPTPPASDCRLTSCWSCWQGLAVMAEYGNTHLRDQNGPIAKQTIRRHFQRDAISWNTVRRGLLAAQPAAMQAQPAAMQAVMQARMQAQLVVQPAAVQAQPAAMQAQPVVQPAAVQAAQPVVQPAAMQAQPAAMQAVMQAVQTCAICFEPCLDACMVLECGHEYHGVCVARWFRRTPTCPTCRALPP